MKDRNDDQIRQLLLESRKSIADQKFNGSIISAVRRSRTYLPDIGPIAHAAAFLPLACALLFWLPNEFPEEARPLASQVLFLSVLLAAFHLLYAVLKCKAMEARRKKN